MTTGAADQSGAQNNTGSAANGGNSGGQGNGNTALGGEQNQNNQNGNNGGQQNQNGGNGSGNGANGGGAVQVFDATKIKYPEGWTADDAIMKDFLPIATKMKMSQEDAQALVDLQVKSIQGIQGAMEQAQTEAYAKQHADWKAALATDKVVGGADLNKNIDIALRAVKKFGDAELINLFQHYDKDKNPTGMGFGNIPALVRAFFKIGQTISEDSFGNQGGNNNQNNVDPAMKLFGPGTEVKSGTG